MSLKISRSKLSKRTINKNLLNIKFDSSPGDSDDTYIKTKTKTNGDNVKYKFSEQKTPKRKNFM